MRKLPIALFSASALFVSAASAQVTWQNEWTDATSFAAASPSWTTTASGGSVTYTTDPNPTVFGATASGSFLFFTADSGFDASTATGSTVEFRMKVNSQNALATNGAVQLIVYGTNTDKRFEVTLSDSGAGFFEGTKHAHDTSVFNTYRLTFGGSSASLYLNGGTTAIATNTVGGSDAGVNLLRIGDISTSDAILGVSEWEYIRWTNAGQFAPVPEPATFAALTGLLALGAVMLRRRRS